MLDQAKQPSWQTIETAIAHEINWLKENILPFHANKNILNYDDSYFYRQIAILIVSGKIKATQYSTNDYTLSIPSSGTLKTKKHGSDWHDSYIEFLFYYFTDLGWQVQKNEPPLYYGHADLKINKNNKTIYFEIDTINIFKLYINLVSMNKVVIINISRDKIIKFEL